MNINNEIYNMDIKQYEFYLSTICAKEKSFISDFLSQVYYIKDIDKLSLDYDSCIKIINNKNPVIYNIIYFKDNKINSYSTTIFNSIKIDKNNLYFYDFYNKKYVMFLPMKFIDKMKFIDFNVIEDKKGNLILYNKKKRIRLKNKEEIYNYMTEKN